jgi:tRNA(Ile2) C34 agmatinyltransferase TiaS
VSADHEGGPIIPHSDFGNPECCGCLFGAVRGGEADMRCNECVALIRTVSASDLERTLAEMELNGDVASAICPQCGAVLLAPGFSRLSGFVCDKCGKGVRLSDDAVD